MRAIFHIPNKEYSYSTALVLFTNVDPKGEPSVPIRRNARSTSGRRRTDPKVCGARVKKKNSCNQPKVVRGWT